MPAVRFGFGFKMEDAPFGLTWEEFQRQVWCEVGKTKDGLPIEAILVTASEDGGLLSLFWEGNGQHEDIQLGITWHGGKARPTVEVLNASPGMGAGKGTKVRVRLGVPPTLKPRR